MIILIPTNIHQLLAKSAKGCVADPSHPFISSIWYIMASLPVIGMPNINNGNSCVILPLLLAVSLLVKQYVLPFLYVSLCTLFSTT